MIPFNRGLSKKQARRVIDQAVAESIPEAAEHTQNKLFKQLRNIRRATVQSAGTVSGTVRVVFTDGTTLDVPVLKMYTSSTVGGAGGPAVGHDGYLLYTSEGGTPVLMGYRV